MRKRLFDTVDNNSLETPQMEPLPLLRCRETCHTRHTHTHSHTLLDSAFGPVSVCACVSVCVCILVLVPEKMSLCVVCVCFRENVCIRESVCVLNCMAQSHYCVPSTLHHGLLYKSCVIASLYVCVCVCAGRGRHACSVMACHSLPPPHGASPSLPAMSHSVSPPPPPPSVPPRHPPSTLLLLLHHLPVLPLSPPPPPPFSTTLSSIHHLSFHPSPNVSPFFTIRLPPPAHHRRHKVNHL